MTDRAESAGPADAAESRARRRLTAAMLVTAAGLAVSGTFSRTWGGVLVVVGWLLLVAALHAFGRAGSRK
jgi:hypothetical protein